MRCGNVVEVRYVGSLQSIILDGANYASLSYNEASLFKICWLC